MYSSGSDDNENVGDGEGDKNGGRVDCDKGAKRTNSVLDSASGSYSDSDITL